MRKAEVILEYQDIIEGPPHSARGLLANSSANDDRTVEFWKHQWIGNITANKQRFGSFVQHSCVSEFNKFKNQPVVLAGSGPSLKKNAHELLNRGSVPIVSALHNFHFLEDLGAPADYYISLDAGDITIREVYVGGKRSPEEYWELSKDRTLCCFIGSHPELLKKWQGRILFFNAPIPNIQVEQAIDAIEDFGVMITSGGNVLGGCLSFAKTILGSPFSIFIGADLSFGYNHKFYSWDDPHYDVSMGQTIRATDIFGNSVRTWASYYGFKEYFESVSLRCPGEYYNCTEGGILGAYPGGNIKSFKYLDLKDMLKMLNLNDEIKENYMNPTQKPRKLLYI